MHEAVSFHAVIRYVERVLGEPCDEWLKDTANFSEEARARLCCQKAGVPFIAAIEMILCKPVLDACLAGFKQCSVRIDGFVYIVQSGRVITVLTQDMYDRTTGRLTRVKLSNRKSKRREILRNEKQFRDKNRARDRQMSEVE